MAVPNFLREQGNFQLFNHPSKGFDLTQRLGDLVGWARSFLNAS